MSLSHLAQIAAAVVSDLNSEEAQEGFGITFVAERQYIAHRSKDELAPGRVAVDVLSETETTDLKDRSNTAETDYGVRVAVRGKVLAENDKDVLSQIDKYMLVAEQIKDRLRAKQLIPGVTLKAIEHISAFDTETMKNHNVLLTAPLFIYRAQRT